METKESAFAKRTGTKRIKTQRLVLRKILPSDFFNIIKWFTDPELYRFSKSHNPPSITRTFRFAAGRLRKYVNKSYYNWAIVYKGKMRGFIEIIEFENKPNCFFVSSKLDMSLKNNGIMTEALTAVTEYLKTQGIYYLFGYCDVDNIGSKRVMEKSGMKIFGDPETNPKFYYDDGTVSKMFAFKLQLNEK